MNRRIAFAIVAVMLMLVSCRTSQQSRRSATAASKSAASAQSKQMDSLIMVQDKLVTVIDTMSSLIADERHRIADLEREVSRLRAMLEERNYAPQQRMQNNMQPAPVAQPLQAQQPVEQPTQQQPPPTTPTPNPRELTGAPPQSSQSQPSQPVPNDGYTTALREFNDGKYTEALAAFDDLYHKDPNSPLAPNYLYWKGESLYALGEYNESIRIFHELLERYGPSGKADAAEFKIGAAYEKLGDTVNAKSAYQRLLLSFPDSEFRSRAETRLKKLK